MPLHLPGPPRGVSDAVSSTLGDLAGRGHHSSEALRTATPDQLNVSTPHQVFTMGLDDLASGAGLHRARPVGWRQLVESDGQPVATIETTLADDGVTHVPSHLNEGPFVKATADAVAAVRGLPQLEAEDFELRVLRIPAVYLMALWLHSPRTDLLMPLAPSPVGREGQLVPAAEVLSELSPTARSRLSADQPEPPDRHAT